MKPREKPRVPAPSEKEILQYDNVPVTVAASYIGWTEHALRLAIREKRAPFGIAVEGEGRYIFNISPGGLVKYKQEGVSVVPFEALQDLMADGVCRLVDAKLGGVGKILRMLENAQ